MADRQSTFTVLLVCTGNICRSAFAERLGRAYLEERLGAAARLVRLESAGTRAVVDSAMHPDTALVLEGYGAAAGDFRARQLVDTLPVEADLILTMTRVHRREVLRAAPRTLQRAFTLLEAAELVPMLDHGGPPAGDDLAERARNLIKGMAVARAQRHGGDGDDVPDPMGRSLEIHEEVGRLIVGALVPVLDRIAGLQ